MRRFWRNRGLLLLCSVLSIWITMWLCYSSPTVVPVVESIEGSAVRAECFSCAETRASVNGVILVLLGRRPERLALAMFRRLEKFFLQRFPYPVHIFHEAMRSGNSLLAITQAVPSARRVEFEDISAIWQKLPAGVSEEMISAWLEKPRRRGFSRGYRTMCRFWAGLVWELPSMDAYEYYWRLDDDSYLTAPAPYDVFQVMQVRHCVYGYRLITRDAPNVVVDLWPTFMRWARKTLSPAEVSVLVAKFVTGNASRGKRKYRPFMFYNNFELGTVALKRHPLYRSMFRFLDEQEPHGFMRWRWGDAPVHTLGVETVLQREGWKKCRFSPKFAGYVHAGNPKILRGASD